MIEILNLGAGVQSTRVLVGSCVGDMPKLAYAIFADTGWEPQAVYDHLEWLEDFVKNYGVKVIRVRQGDLREDALVVQKSGKSEKGKRWGSLPYFTRKIWERDDINELRDLLALQVSEGKSTYKIAAIIEEVEHTGRNIQDGMIRRQCTYEYKIRPIDLYIRREVLGLKPRQRTPKEVVIRQWFGISYDEFQRARTPEHKFVENYYPLIDRRITRQQCLSWLADGGYPEPPRSACIGCPFHSDAEWREIKLNPEEWADACEFDRSIRNCGGMRGKVYLHASRIPLEDVDFQTDWDKGQLPLWDNECSGICGV